MGCLVKEPKHIKIVIFVELLVCSVVQSIEVPTPQGSISNLRVLADVINATRVKCTQNCLKTNYRAKAYRFEVSACSLKIVCTI